MRDKRLHLAAIALVVVIGVLVRCWGIAGNPLWLDEGYSAYAADHDFAFLWRIVPLYEGHPPFYYTLLHMWVGLFGNSLLALRALGLCAGFATIALTAWAADEAGRWIEWDAPARRRLTLAATAFASLSLALVEMAHEVRPYPMMILAYAAAILALLGLARRAAAGRSIAGPLLALYLLLLEANLWLHNLGPLYGLALTIALAIAVLRKGIGRRDWLWLVAGHAVVALFYLPGLAIMLSQSTTWIARTWLHFSLDIGLIDHIMTLYGVPGWVAVASPLLAGLAVAALCRAPRGKRLTAMLLVLALLPVLLAILLSLTIAPVFITRVMTPTAVPAVLMLAIGAAAGGRYARLGISGAVLICASLLTADVQARMGRPMQEWYRAVDWLAARFQPGDQIYAYPNEGKLPLVYALRDKGLHYPIRAIPVDTPALEIRHGWHPTGTRGVSSLPRAELHAIAQEPATRAVPTIWLLRLGAPTYDPGDSFLRELHPGRRIVRTFTDGPIEIIGLKKLPNR